MHNKLKDVEDEYTKFRKMSVEYDFEFKKKFEQCEK